MSNLLSFTVVIAFFLKTNFVISSHQEPVMKDYCTLRPLVVRVQARMYIFWKFDILGFLAPTTTLKHLIWSAAPPGDEIPREDLPSLRLRIRDLSLIHI